MRFPFISMVQPFVFYDELHVVAERVTFKKF